MSDKNLATYDPEAVAFHRMIERLKLMITNGKKLSDAEAAALAQFAVAEKLDPFSGEVYLLKNESKNEIIGPMVGVKGLRRKAQERLGLDENYMLDFVLVDNPPGVLFAYECRLRDTQSLRKYLDLRCKAEEMFRASGHKTPSDEALKLVGPPPVWFGHGYFYQSEQNDYKDKKYHPREKAQKRAEAAALKKRFSLNYHVGDNGDSGVVEVTDGEYYPDVTDPIEYIDGDVTEESEPAPAIEYPAHLTDVTNKEGVRYVEMGDGQLAYMASEIRKASHKDKGDENKQAQYALKLDAIKEIQALRAGK